DCAELVEVARVRGGELEHEPVAELAATRINLIVPFATWASALIVEAVSGGVPQRPRLLGQRLATLAPHEPAAESPAELGRHLAPSESDNEPVRVGTAVVVSQHAERLRQPLLGGDP